MARNRGDIHTYTCAHTFRGHMDKNMYRNIYEPNIIILKKISVFAKCITQTKNEKKNISWQKYK